MQKHCSMLLAAATIGLAASQALAADLPRKAPPPAVPMAPPITWTGCYIGANIGGIFSDRSAHFTDSLGFFGEVSTDNSGFTGGGQIGCDYQFAGGWVIGIRNMFNGTSLSRDASFFDGAGNLVTVDFKNNWFDALTGRLGYSWAPGWLLYGQGGVVWAKNSVDVTIAGFDVGSASRTRTGWTAGGGVEWMFTRGWSAFLEGNYYDFGDHDRTIFDPVVCVVGCAFNTKTTAASVLVGVNWRWGGKAPGY